MNTLLVLSMIVFSLIIAYMFYHVQKKLWLKVIIIGGMIYLSSAIYFSFGSYMGWPTNGELAPDGALIYSIVITEKPDHSDGAIFVMAVPCFGASDITCLRTVYTDPSKDDSWSAYLKNKLELFGYAPLRKNTPRLYEFPFTQKNRENFSKAKEHMDQEGGSIFLRRGDPGDGGGVAGEGGAEGDGLDIDPGSGYATQGGGPSWGGAWLDLKSPRDLMKK